MRTIASIGITLLWLVGVAAAQPTYTVYPLGNFFPTAIASNGLMAGSRITTAQQAARGQADAITDLMVDGVALAQTSTGLTAGYSGCYDAGCINQEATLWDSAGQKHLLGLLPGGYTSSATCFGPNDAIGGYAEASVDTVRAVVFQGGSIRVLPSLGGTWDAVIDCNASGQYVGESAKPNGHNHAVLWDAGGVHDLGTLGGTYSLAYAIDANGLIRGMATDAQGYGHATLFVKGKAPVALPDPVGYSECYAVGGNLLGQSVGSCTQQGGEFPPVEHAVLWMAGAVYDLNALITEPGWVIEGASGINAAGLIAAQGHDQGVRQGVLLVPAVIADSPKLAGYFGLPD
jgi:probable HAF family extracellular repeat protein